MRVATLFALVAFRGDGVGKKNVIVAADGGVSEPAPRHGQYEKRDPQAVSPAV